MTYVPNTFSLGADLPEILPQLEDHNGNVIAFYRPIRPVRYNLGDVYGELHFCRSAGAGVVVSVSDSSLMRVSVQAADSPP